MSIRSEVLESRLEVPREPRLLPRIQTAREIESDHSVHHRQPDAGAAHRRFYRERGTIADPTEIAERHQTISIESRPDLAARHPERVAALCGIGTLTANRVRATQIPESLWRNVADTRAG